MAWERSVRTREVVLTAVIPIAEAAAVRTKCVLIRSGSNCSEGGREVGEREDDRDD